MDCDDKPFNLIPGPDEKINSRYNNARTAFTKRPRTVKPKDTLSSNGLAKNDKSEPAPNKRVNSIEVHLKDEQRNVRPLHLEGTKIFYFHWKKLGTGRTSVVYGGNYSSC
jgi:hypothetical protein